MARIDPHTIGLNGNGRTALGIADLGARVAMLERGGGGIPGGGSGLVGAIGDTSNIDLTMTGATLTADIPTTATPQVTGISFVAGAGLAYSDAQGDDLKGGTGQVLSTWPGNRVMISQGTAAAPLTTALPTIKVTRTQEITGSVPEDAPRHAAICAVAVATALDETMVTGIVGAAHTYSSTGTPANDACGIWGVGQTLGTNSSGFGAYFEGKLYNAGGLARGIEVACYSQVDADSTYSATGVGNNPQVGIWLASRNGNNIDGLDLRLGGTGLAIGYIGYASTGAQWDVGIGFLSQNGGAVATTSIRDDCSSATSIQINGTHATAALAIAAGSGHVVIGTSGADFLKIVNTGTVTRLGIGVSPGYPFQIERATDLAYFRGVGVNTRLLLDTDTASKQAVFVFSDQAVTKWSMGKQTTSDFFIFNNTTNTTQAAAQNAFVIDDVTNVIQLGAGIAYDGSVSLTPVRIDCTMHTFSNGHFGTRATDGIDSDAGNTATGVHWNFYHGGSTIADKGSLTMFAGYITANQFDVNNNTYLETVVYEGQTTINRAGGSFQVAEFVNRITAGNPARSSVASLIIEESNPIADYTEAIFGTGSRFAAAAGRTGLGSIGLTVMSNLTRRGGTAIWVGGYHASQFTSAGVAGTDNREFERALVVTVGAYVGVPGLDKFVLNGDGSAQFGSGTANCIAIANNGSMQLARTSTHVFHVVSAIGDANPKFSIRSSDARLEWTSGAASTDVQLGRDSTNGLKITGTSGFLTAVGSITGAVLSISGLTGGSTDGYLLLNEVATSVAAANANTVRVYAKDDGSANTSLWARFQNNERMIRKDVAAQTYTQTYATADRTLGAYTADVESAAYTGAADGEAKLADLNALRVAYENLRVFAEDGIQMLNALVNDSRTEGIVA